jgi:hypothetical protein
MPNRFLQKPQKIRLVAMSLEMKVWRLSSLIKFIIHRADEILPSVVAIDCQSFNRNLLGFNLSILQQKGILGAADEPVLST